MNMDLSMLEPVLPYLRDAKYQWIAIGVMVILCAAIFFINFKKKNGLVYCGVAFILSSVVSLALGFGTQAIGNAISKDAADIIGAVGGPLLANFKTIGFIFLGIGAAFIIAFILIRVLSKKKK